VIKVCSTYYCQGMGFFGKKAEQWFGKYNKEKPTFFVGLYFDECYKTFLQHSSDRYVFWNGSDVLRLLRNSGHQEILKKVPAIHACHNEQLIAELASVGVKALIRPIFFGDVNKYKKTACYMIAHPGRESEYGVDQVIQFAEIHPEYNFSVYGLSGVSSKNILYKGHIDENIMDSEIEKMNICLRLNKHDGFSQTVIKALLMGHRVVTDINFLELPVNNFDWLE